MGCPVTDVIESVEVDQICVNQVLILTSHLRLFQLPPYRRALFTQITPSAIQTGENETEKYLAKKISLQRVHKKNGGTPKSEQNVIFQTHK